MDINHDAFDLFELPPELFLCVLDHVDEATKIALTLTCKRFYRRFPKPMKPLPEETLRALNDHELIKVKVAGEDREARTAVIDAIVEATGAEAVQKIGKIVLLYKKAAKQNQHLSNLVRHAHLAN